MCDLECNTFIEYVVKPPNPMYYFRRNVEFLPLVPFKCGDSSSVDDIQDDRGKKCDSEAITKKLQSLPKSIASFVSTVSMFTVSIESTMCTVSIVSTLSTCVFFCPCTIRLGSE